MGYHDAAAVIHVHSVYSDGTGTVREIAEAGRRTGADVVLLTDHDTLAAADRGEEGWYGETLLLAGHEVSPKNRSHYLAFDTPHAIDHKGMSPAEVVAAVNAAGGFGIIAHPFSRGSQVFSRAGKGMPWGDLAVDGFTGIELWSFVTDTFESLTSYKEIPRFLATPNRVVDHPPDGNVEEWDRMCQARRVVAIGGLDAHQAGKRVGNRVPIRLMSYRRSFRTLRTHLMLDAALPGDVDEARRLVYAAIRAGHCYLAMDSLAPARGFAFTATAAGRQDRLIMGDQGPTGAWELRAELPSPAAELRLIKDGRPLVTTRRSTELSLAITDPGVYRVEATRRHAGRDRTWIMSNPIYLRG